MTLGSVQWVLVCAQDGTVSDSACPAGLAKKSVEAYVISPVSAQYLDPLADPFDYVTAGGFWALAFTSVLALYLVSHAAGSLLNLVKRR